MGGMQGQNRQGGGMPQHNMMGGPMGMQQNMPLPNQQPIGGQQQMMAGQQMAGQQFAGQQAQREQTIQEKYLATTLPILPGITAENPYYRNQVGTAIYEFVVALKGDKAPKITGMLIDLQLNEIQMILKNYELLVQRVNQADALLSQNSQPAQQTAGQ